MLIARIDPKIDPRYEQERDLRYRVLRAPLGMPRSLVGFAGEEDAVHVVALDGLENETVIGCVLFDFESGRLRAMAVDPARQGQGIGAMLVESLESEVRQAGVREISLHARDVAIGFYERMGYAVEGEEFLEVGIPHVTMVKRF